MKLSTLILLFLVIVGLQCTPLTFHLKVHQVKSTTDRPYSHLKHLAVTNQTYKLKPRMTLFTLNFVVNGFDYDLSVDTGSSDFFIKGEGMAGAPQQKFSCEQCIQLNQKVKIAYLDGHLMTYRTQANITMGNHTFKQHILVAYHANSANYDQFGGIVGLSFQQIAKNDYPNFMNTLILNKIIENNVFGVKLDLYDKQRSFITFGGQDDKYIAQGQTVKFYKIPDKVYRYRLKLNGFTMGGKQFTVEEALLDTGNTCISIPDKFTADILEKFNTKGNTCKFDPEPGNSRFDIMRCTIGSFDELPIMTFKFGQQSYPVGKQYYISKCTKQQDNFHKCQTLIQIVRKRSEVLLGDAFFLRYYAVFDIGNRQIGLAKNDDTTTMEDILKRT